MFVVTGGRASGKTEAVVRWLHEDPSNRCVLVADAQRARHMVDRLSCGSYRNYDWRPHVMHAASVQLGGYARGLGRPFHFPLVAVDDMEEVFRVLFGASLEFATMLATWIPLGPVAPDPIKADVVEGREITGGTVEHIEIYGRPRSFVDGGWNFG